MKKELLLLASNKVEQEFANLILQHKDDDLRNLLSKIIHKIKISKSSFYMKCFIITLDYRISILKIKLGDMLAEENVDYQEMKNMTESFYEGIKTITTLNMTVDKIKNQLKLKEDILKAIDLKAKGEELPIIFRNGPEAEICSEEEDISIDANNCLFCLKNQAAAKYISKQGAKVRKTLQGGTHIEGPFVLEKGVGIIFEKNMAI